MRIPTSALLVPGLAVLFSAAPASGAPLQPGTYHEALRCAAIDTIFAAVMQADDAADSKQKAEMLDGKTRKWLMVADALKSGTKEEMAADYAREANAASDKVMKQETAEIAQDLEHCMEREAVIFP